LISGPTTIYRIDPQKAKTNDEVKIGNSFATVRDPSF
jgi:hypothetical protein